MLSGPVQDTHQRYRRHDWGFSRWSCVAANRILAVTAGWNGRSSRPPS